MVQNLPSQSRSVLPPGLKTQVQGFIDQMLDAQNKYKAAINAHYEIVQREEPLFRQDRDDCIDNYAQDIERFLELVVHCLRVRDFDILDQWGINPLFERGGLSRLASSNLSRYERTFSNLANESKDGFELLCMNRLRDAFQSLRQDKPSLATGHTIQKP
jgi:hypothetical protein